MASDAYIPSLEALGVWCRKYHYQPLPSAIDPCRSSFREDLAVEKAVDILSEINETIERSADSRNCRVLDACCGKAVVAERLWKSLRPEHYHRIDYVGLDQDRECVETANAERDKFKERFADFDVKVWDAFEPMMVQGPFDLVYMANALHEVEPSKYARMFVQLNRVLAKERGRLYIVDLETLPVRMAESIAINWTADEIDAMLRCGGFEPTVTPHPRPDTMLFVARASAIDMVKEQEIDDFVRNTLHKKMKDTITFRLSRRFLTDDELVSIQQWLQATGTIARCAEELSKWAKTPTG